MRFTLLSLFAFFSTLSLLQCIHSAPSSRTDNQRYSGTINYIEQDNSAITLRDGGNALFVCDETQRLLTEGFQVGSEVTFLKKPKRSKDTAYDVQHLWSSGVISWIKKDSNSVTLKDSRGRNWPCDKGKDLIANGFKVGDHVFFKRKGPPSEQTAFSVTKA